MSAPMGVPTQRLGSSKSSSTRRQGPVAISRSSKLQQKAPAPSRTQSDASPSKSSSAAAILRRSNTAAVGLQLHEGGDSQKEKPGSITIGTRRIATNSRIKKDEQNRRDMYLAFINNALKAKSEGNSAPYEELVGQFSSTASPSDYTQLQRWLVALQHVVSQLGQRQAALVEAIVHMPWTTSPDEGFVKSYIEFIGMLVTARAEWRNLVVASAAKRLTHRSSLNASPPAAPSPTAANRVTLRIIFNRTHLLMQNLLSLVPTLLPTLPSHFLRCFPHKSHSVASHNVYCRNLIEVMGYCPQIVEPILSLIVERAVSIDVEIQVELEDLEDLATSGDDADADGKNASGLLNNFDPFDTLAGQESGSESGNEEDDEGLPGAGDVANFSDISSEGEGDEEEDTKEGGKEAALSTKEVEKRAKRVREMVAKLDSVMNVLLEWLSQTSIDSPSSTGQNDAEPPEQHPYFSTLLAIFDRTILTTFKSRYTQFLLFYLVSLPSFPSNKLPTAAIVGRGASLERSNLPPESNLPNPHADYFLGLLLHNTLVPQSIPIPVLTRIASASYLASFVSRALCVGQSDCRQAVTLCCQWINGRLVELEGLLSGSTTAMDENGDARAELSVFYAVVQAVFLIFCFRWRDLLEVVGDVEDGDEEEQGEAKKKWLNELSVVQRLIVSPLNPLKVCSPNVVLQFSRISQKVGFVYCQSIIESNRRAANFTTASRGSENSGSTTPSTMNSSLSTWNAAIASSSAAIADLQAFFPFDPYRLPQSSRWFEGMYRDWTMVAIGDDDEEDEEDEDDESEEDEEAVAASVAVQVGGTREMTAETEKGDAETETTEDEDEEELYGVPMELGSVRQERNLQAQLGVSESFGKMSISPAQGGLHRHVGGRLGS